MAHAVLRLPTLIALGLLRVYRAIISPLYGQVCRFYPSCSAYSYQAIDQHGLFKGVFLTTRRLLRCHPWARGGVDEVPARFPSLTALFRRAR